ncbi:MAG TPA: polysaccharide pyruvyl transferase family protein, partial [Arthrobacter sp.]|nr:polysaccharide pyruvyl transferase family protein [Arthrobacter sp.]
MNSGIIYLVGTSGHPNFGDEFIAKAWLKYLAVARPDADVWLDSPQPGLAQVLFEGLHPRLRVTNTLWRLVHENAELPADVAAKYIRERVTGL